MEKNNNLLEDKIIKLYNEISEQISKETGIPIDLFCQPVKHCTYENIEYKNSLTK